MNDYAASIPRTTTRRDTVNVPATAGTRITNGIKPAYVNEISGPPALLRDIGFG